MQESSNCWRSSESFRLLSSQKIDTIAATRAASITETADSVISPHVKIFRNLFFLPLFVVGMPVNFATFRFILVDGLCLLQNGAFLLFAIFFTSLF